MDNRKVNMRGASCHVSVNTWQTRSSKCYKQTTTTCAATNKQPNLSITDDSRSLSSL